MIDSVLPGNYHVLLLLWRPRSSSVWSACVLGRLKDCYYFDDKDIDNALQWWTKIVHSALQCGKFT